MITIRCKVCQKEMTSSHRTQACGCPNRTEICEDKISAVDLSNVVIVKSDKGKSSNSVLTPEDMMFQEERRKRKVRKLNFEVK